MANRDQNERKFGHWTDQSDGGRCYWLEIVGRYGWRARYFKIVDASEQTLKFWQEIYDETGKLVEIHHKFPVDEGHKKV
jgi:hypothetical protein